jgi:hypothetical protein
MGFIYPISIQHTKFGSKFIAIEYVMEWVWRRKTHLKTSVGKIYPMKKLNSAHDNINTLLKTQSYIKCHSPTCNLKKKKSKD